MPRRAISAAIVMGLLLAAPDARAQESTTQLAATTQNAATQAATAPSVESKRLPGSAENRPVSRGDGSAAGDWLQTAGALALVIALILALRLVLRKVAVKNAPAAGRGGAVEIIARTGISPRQHLLLVRLGTRLVLVGATPGSLNTLAEVADTEEAASLIEAAGRNADAFRKLADALRKQRGGGQ